MRAVAATTFVALVLFTTASFAKDLTNQPVISVIKYCDAIFNRKPVPAAEAKDCTQPITARLGFAMMLAVAAKKDPKSCGLTSAGDAQASAVIVWLGNHANVQSMKYDDGIQAAIKDLWPCVQ